jgi:hypothetical protein
MLQQILLKVLGALPAILFLEAKLTTAALPPRWALFFILEEV